MSAVISIHAYYRDRPVGADGVPIADTGWRKNLIVLRCRMLLAAFLKNDGALGIQSMQVGRGSAAWDGPGAPLPDANTVNALVDGTPFTIPVASLVLNYLDANESVSAQPTNRIQITATLPPGQPPTAGGVPYPLREFALFGQVGGTSYMIDCIRHPLIEKDAAVTLERRVRLFL